MKGPAAWSRPARRQASKPPAAREPACAARPLRRGAAALDGAALDGAAAAGDAVRSARRGRGGRRGRRSRLRQRGRGQKGRASDGASKQKSNSHQKTCTRGCAPQMARPAAPDYDAMVTKFARRRTCGNETSIRDDDVKAARPVRAEQQGLLDVARARRPGDEVERARREALAVTLAQLGEDRFRSRRRRLPVSARRCGCRAEN